MSKLDLPFADKSLGQHFLKDQLIIKKICEDFANQCESIVEIGPGPGILTEHLALIKKPFFVIEKDKRFDVYLEQFIEKEQVTFADALSIDLSDFYKGKNINHKSIWLVSNLPYNVASPLLINFLQSPEIKFMTLMFQKEVADKVFPFATTKNFMSSLLVLSQSYFDCKLLCKVPPGAFTPPPKVDSAVLSMIRKETPLVPLNEFQKLEKFLRILFSQKRKQLGGVLKSSFNVNHIASVFEELSIPLSIRAEALSLEQVLDLYRKLS